MDYDEDKSNPELDIHGNYKKKNQPSTALT